jgi:hypothetical protein
MSISRLNNHKLIDGTYSSRGGADFTDGGTIDNNNLVIDTDDAEALLVRKDGDAGDVFKVDTIAERIEYKDGNQQSGYLLTSDANGVATWQAATPLGGTIDNNLIIDINNVDALLIRKDGDTGDVFKVDTIAERIEYKDGNQQSGYILTSDANGVATWQIAATASQVTVVDGVQTQPSINFINDTDTGIYRTSTGEFNFVKGAVPVLTIDSGMAIVNNSVCSRSYDIGQVTFNSPSSLGTAIAIYDYNTDIFTSETGGFTLEENVNIDNSDIVPTFLGRTNVLAISNTSQYVRTKNTDNIASIQGLDDFFISFWWKSATTAANNLWSFHNGTSDISDATDYIRLFVFGFSGNQLRLEIVKAGSQILLQSIFITAGIWNHIVIEFSTTLGLTYYVNNGSPSNLPLITESLSTIPITTFTIGDEINIVSQTTTYLDSIVLVAGNTTAQKVDDLFNDNISFTGVATFAKQSALTYDTNDGKTKLELSPSTDVFSADSSGLSVDLPLTISGDRGVLFSNHKLFTGAEAIYYFQAGSLLADGSGNGRDLTQSGSPSFGTVLGKEAVTFSVPANFTNATVGAVLAGNNTVISMWFRTTSSSDGITLINIDESVTTTNNYLRIFMRSGANIGGNDLEGDLQWLVTPSKGGYTTVNGYNDGKWHHLVMNSLSTGHSIYIDGVAPSVVYNIGAQGDDYRIDASLDELNIGSFNTTSYWVGDIAEVVLTQNEITLAQAGEIYNGMLVSGNNVTINELKVLGLEADEVFVNKTESLTSNYIGAYAGSADIQLSKVGPQVVMTITDTGDVTAVANSTITYNSISSDFRPLNDVQMPIRVKDNGVYQFGVISITTLGVIEVFPSATGGLFTNATTIRLAGGSYSWNVIRKTN